MENRSFGDLVPIKDLNIPFLLLMEELLHHLLHNLYMKPYEKWDILHINWLARFLKHQQYVS